MKGKTVQIWKLYQVEGAVLKRINRFCPKCGTGTFMAKHKDRWYCGRCGYTEFITDKRR
ncbi:MAG: 30S ribosomal protein S27ae [Nitrososphaeria archaeon]